MSKGEVHLFSARLPMDVWDALRALAYDRQTTKNAQLVRILRNGLAAEADEKYLAEHVREILRRLRAPEDGADGDPDS